MKPKPIPNLNPKFPSRILILGASFLCSSSLYAADGLWTADADGDWGTAANWDSSIVADGAGFTATFDGITADHIVTLDSARTIGHISAADTSNNFTISGANTLTLDLTTGIPTVTVANGRILTISSVLAGNDGLHKSNSGDFRPRGANTFTGGVELAAGIINLTDDGNEASFLGAAANVLTFTGDARLHNDAGKVTLPQGITINGGVTGEVSGAFGETFEIDGVLDGSGTLAVSGFSAGYKAEFRNTANTFTGPIVANSTDSLQVKFASLLDSPGATTIGLDSAYNNGATFEYTSAAIVPLVLNNRQFELIENGNSGTNTGRQAQILNNASTANTMTINTDLLVTGTGTKNLVLAGGNTGDNTFAGVIPDGSAALSLYKDDGGKWILTGANTYTGTTTIKNGTLEIQGDGTYANINSIDGSPNPLTVNTAATTTVTGTVSGSMEVIKDGVGTLAVTGSLSHTGGTNVDNGTLSLGDGTNNASLDDFGTLDVASGATVDLNYVGSDTVLNLVLNGVSQPAGTYDATSDPTYFTGAGEINCLGGDTTALNIAYWDGGSIDIIGGGNAASDGGAGTWDTTTKNWDIGTVDHDAWFNTPLAEAVFGGSPGTVTVSGPITLRDLTFNTTSNTDYIIDGGTLNFSAGGTIDHAVTNKEHTITSAITGSPTVDIAYHADKAYPGGIALYKGLTFAPTSGTVALGTANVPPLDYGGDKAGLWLGGTTTGNSVDTVQYAGGNKYGSLYKKDSGTWTVGNVDIGTCVIEDGTLIVNGTLNTYYSGFHIVTTGRLAGNGTIEENVSIPAGCSIAPGASVGTLSVTGNTAIVGTLEIEVDGATADVLALTGDLDLTGGTIVVTELGAATLTDYTIATYTGTRTGTFDTETLPAGYSVDYSTANEINLVVAGGGSPFDTWATGGETFEGDANGDGVQDGMAFLLGAATPSTDANSLLPVVTDDGLGGLVMTFSMLNAATRGASTMDVEHSSDLGISDDWLSTLVPEADGGPTNGVTFLVTPDGTMNDVVATIAISEAAAGKLFGRLVGEQ